MLRRKGRRLKKPRGHEHRKIPSHRVHKTDAGPLRHITALKYIRKWGENSKPIEFINFGRYGKISTHKG